MKDFELQTVSWIETLLVRIFGRKVYYKDVDGEVWGAWFRGRLYLLKTTPVPETCPTMRALDAAEGKSSQNESDATASQ